MLAVEGKVFLDSKMLCDGTGWDVGEYSGEGYGDGDGDGVMGWDGM